MTLAEVVLSHGDNNEATAVPYWGIVQYTRSKRVVMLAGVWFNREDAEAYLKAKAYNFPKSAVVYCFSGHYSWHLKEIYAIAKGETE